MVNLWESAMYPTTDIEYGLLSRKFENPDDFRKMRDFRLEMKAAGNPKNKALKPLINGVYGAGKDRSGASYDPLMGNLTCIFGQMFILDLVDKLEPYCRILQTNTDGIFVLCKDEEMKKKVIEITISCGNRTHMEYEIEEYSKLIQKDVNNYIAVTKDGKLECKGAMVKFNTPIDNDLPILNDAVRNYLAYSIPVEETINNCNELIKFQKVIKLSSKYKEVWYGSEVKEKTKSKEKDVIKVTSINGEMLNGKVHRLFASKRESDGGIYKLKIEKGEKSYEKFANTPDHLFIDNSDIHNTEIPEYLDKQYYINEAKKRVDMFLTKEPEVIDETPNILFNCLLASDTYCDFLYRCQENKITNKVLEGYVKADCCKKFGKTKRLLDFKKYFDYLNKKEKISVSQANKKYKDEEWIVDIISKNSVLSKTGKQFTELNYKNVLNEIFNQLENIDIEAVEIMKEQISKFGRVIYTDPTLKTNRYFVLNWRNVIAPNVNIYNMKTGEVEYRKVDKAVFNILPLKDGDIIDVTTSELRYGQKYIGKDENGVNIIAADIEKNYDVITGYEFVHLEDIKSIED